MSPTDLCVFDEIVSGERPSHVVLDEPDLFGFLDQRPVFPGHTLVVPRIHVETIGELPAPLVGPLFEAGRRVASSQRSALGSQGTFFALNDVVSQSVPHVHLHVIPRSKGDGLRGFLWPRGRYASEDEAEGIAQLLRDALLSPGGARPGDPAPAAGDRVVIRSARGDDARVVAELLAGGSRLEVEDPDDEVSYRAAIEEIAGTPGATVLVAEVGGEVVGVCQLYTFRHLQQRGGLCAEIESVHVRDRARNHGVGGALVEAAVDEARKLGCFRVQLTSHKSRSDAHRFYVAHGFEASHEGFKRYL